MGFPPKTKNSSRNIPDTDSTKNMTSKGKGGIPATLKIKNAANKEAVFPRRAADPANPDKTISLS